MVLLNANHFTSLFCSKPFIGFLHIQSKTFLKCRKDLALAIALSLFFSPLLTCSTPNSSKPPPPTSYIDIVTSLLFVKLARKSTPIPGPLRVLFPLSWGPSFRQQQSSVLHLIRMSASVLTFLSCLPCPLYINKIAVLPPSAPYLCIATWQYIFTWFWLLCQENRVSRGTGISLFSALNLAPRTVPGTYWLLWCIFWKNKRVYMCLLNNEDESGGTINWQ